MAADLPAAVIHKAPPPPAVAPSWTGFYLGVNGGASIGRNRTTALGAGLVPANSQTTTSSYTVRDHIVRFGVNYRLN